ncbi:MAG: hypothetical protein OEY88_11615 [Candidatus Bathyarchaeota archaeon]|nr:hypothetical protein [Candidatus Bathyarchaeota archaeon]
MPRPIKIKFACHPAYHKNVWIIWFEKYYDVTFGSWAALTSVPFDAPCTARRSPNCRVGSMFAEVTANEGLSVFTKALKPERKNADYNDDY